MSEASSEKTEKNGSEETIKTRFIFLLGSWILFIGTIVFFFIAVFSIIWLKSWWDTRPVSPKSFQLKEIRTKKLDDGRVTEITVSTNPPVVDYLLDSHLKEEKKFYIDFLGNWEAQKKEHQTDGDIIESIVSDKKADDNKMRLSVSLRKEIEPPTVNKSPEGLIITIRGLSPINQLKDIIGKKLTDGETQITVLTNPPVDVDSLPRSYLKLKEEGKFYIDFPGNWEVLKKDYSDDIVESIVPDNKADGNKMRLSLSLRKEIEYPTVTKSSEGIVITIKSLNKSASKMKKSIVSADNDKDDNSSKTGIFQLKDIKTEKLEDGGIKIFVSTNPSEIKYTYYTDSIQESNVYYIKFQGKWKTKRKGYESETVGIDDDIVKSIVSHVDKQSNRMKLAVYLKNKNIQTPTVAPSP